MTLFRRARTFAQYGPTRVAANFHQAVGLQFSGGLGVVNGRNALRQSGFTFSNAVYSAIRAEYRAIANTQTGLNALRLDFKPGKQTLVRTGREFSTQFQYAARVQVRDFESGELEDIVANFGSDVELTRGQIMERAEAIAEEAMEHAVIGTDIPVGDIEGVTITAAMERRR